MVILGVWAVVYAIVCMPAVQRRGYPPIDPFWMAMPWLWVGGIMLSAIFDQPRPSQQRAARVQLKAQSEVAEAAPGAVLEYQTLGRSPHSPWSRTPSLIVFALFTALVDAATVGGMVPRRMSMLGAIGGMIMFGPLHLLVTAIVEGVSQRVLARFRRFDDCGGRFPAILKIGGTLLLAGFIAFPFLYRRLALASLEKEGIRRADADWSRQEVGIYADQHCEVDEVGNYSLTALYDSDTGFEWRANFRHGFESSYNARVQERLRSEGPPAWSMRRFVIGDQDWSALMTASNFETITQFPHDVNENICLMYGGYVERWGVGHGSAQASPSVLTRRRGGWSFGSVYWPVEVGRSAKHPGLVFVRIEHKVLAAITEDGHVVYMLSERR